MYVVPIVTTGLFKTETYGPFESYEEAKEWLNSIGYERYQISTSQEVFRTSDDVRREAYITYLGRPANTPAYFHKWEARIRRIEK